MTREFIIDGNGTKEVFVGTRREILSVCKHLDREYCGFGQSKIERAENWEMFGVDIDENDYSVMDANTVLALITQAHTVDCRIGNRWFRFTGNAREAKSFLEAKREECESMYGFGWWNQWEVEIDF